MTEAERNAKIIHALRISKPVWKKAEMLRSESQRLREYSRRIISQAKGLRPRGQYTSAHTNTPVPKCDAFFPSDMLTAELQEDKESINSVIKVSLYVNLDDVVGIFVTAEKGETIPLYTPVG